MMIPSTTWCSMARFPPPPPRPRAPPLADGAAPRRGVLADAGRHGVARHEARPEYDEALCVETVTWACR